jgi:hypothetical protein
MSTSWRFAAVVVLTPDMHFDAHMNFYTPRCALPHTLWLHTQSGAQDEDAGKEGVMKRKVMSPKSEPKTTNK